MFKKIRQWWWFRRMRHATQREIVLAGRLEAAEQKAKAYAEHYEDLRGDYLALVDDHEALKERFAELQYARLQDFSVGRYEKARARA